MAKKTLTPSAKALARFIEQNTMTKTAAAAGIGVSLPTLLDYLSGAKRPSSIRREVIERYTGGLVARDGWDLRSERAELERTAPFSVAAPDVTTADSSPVATDATKGAA